MTQAILISIQPQHVLNILNGSKTLELRKSVPKGYVGWCYIYVTKGKPYLIKHPYHSYMLIEEKGFDTLNGKVVARFWFDEYDSIKYYYDEDGMYENFAKYKNGIYWAQTTTSKDMKQLMEKSCVSYDELVNYFGDEYRGNAVGYAWHIKKLEVLDQPMGLGEFNMFNKEAFTGYFRLTKAPQSWQYVWVKENV